MMSNWIKRKNTKVVSVGNVKVGGTNPISVQSMTNTNTSDVISTVKQINDLEAAGADIVRVSVPGFDEAKAFKEIKKAVSIPLVADIHFDYKIALEVADTADCLRINPGNIGKESKIKEVIDWHPKFSLKETIHDTSKWVYDNKELLSKIFLT